MAIFAPRCYYPLEMKYMGKSSSQPYGSAHVPETEPLGKAIQEYSSTFQDILAEHSLDYPTRLEHTDSETISSRDHWAKTPR